MCALIARDPGTNWITNVRDVFQNINEARVRGIDYELVFNAEPDWFSSKSESLNFRFLAGRLLEDSNTLLGGPAPDYPGHRRPLVRARYEAARERAL